MDITYQYNKLRKNFGRQPMFSDKGPELCDSIVSDPQIQKMFILRNPVHQITQHGPIFSHCEINTIRAELTRTGVNHSEGGWPKDVNILDPEATQRYRRKIEKDEEYIHCVNSVTPGMEYYVLQNNAIDMYEAYYASMPSLPPLEQVGCRTVNVFMVKNDVRPVSSISWRPDGGHHYSTSYVNMDFNRNTIGSLDAYIWNIDNPNIPLTTITPPSSLLDLQYNPRDENMLLGGLASGQVIIFDQRVVGRKPVQSSDPFGDQRDTIITPAFTSHRDMVTKVLFINTKVGTEFFSGSTDGSLKWWDLRNMDVPTDEQIVHVVESNFEQQTMVKAHAVCEMQYVSTIPTRYMVGTDDGFVITGNRKGKSPVERLPAKYYAHHGPVNALERNPFFLKNFLTIGDWTLKVWSEDCRESFILNCPAQRIRLTSATWSPTRVSLISSTYYNGQFACWDLLRKQNEPIFTQQVSKEPLLKICAHEGGSFVACGSKLGKVYLIELTSALSRSEKNDKALMGAVFERESKRERILESRLREIRLKLRQVEEGIIGSPKASVIDLTIGDKDLHEAGHDYIAQVKKEQASVY